MINPLTGINILVTRPAQQASYLADRIRASGGDPILFPVLEIREITNQRPLLDLIERIDEFDLAIFISPNAANKAMSRLKASRTLPARLKIAAVGQGTARELEKFGVNEVITPTTRFDSEALLDLPELSQMEGKRVVIFRGDGGRELLGDTLLKRGAILEYAECYRRVKPNLDIAPLLQAWASGRIDAVIITSSEGLRNLCDMIGESGQALLKKTPLFASHERIAQTARQLGFMRVISTPAGDDGLIESLSNYFRPGANGESLVSKKS